MHFARKTDKNDASRPVILNQWGSLPRGAYQDRWEGACVVLKYIFNVIILIWKTKQKNKYISIAF
jgi:hypothetical protein